MGNAYIMEKLILTFFFVIVLKFGYGQTSDSVVYLTDLETQKNYFTFNTFQVDRDGLHLFYSLRFDDKNSWDDEYIRTIYLQIPSPTLSEYSVTDLLKYYSEKGAIIAERETQNLSGKIIILNITDTSLTVDLNIKVNFGGQKLTCIGQKEFKSAHKNN